MGEDHVSAQNLAASFRTASASMARLRWFADQADVDGYPGLAVEFRAAAEIHAGHVHGYLEFLSEGGDSDTGLPFGETEDNVSLAVAILEQQAAELAQYAASASADGRQEIAEWFDSTARANVRLGERLAKAQGELRQRWPTR